MSINIDDYIYAQYQDTPIANILRNLQDLYQKDYTAFLEYIQNALLSIKTADNFGLECWGAYLNLSRIYEIKLPSKNTEWFGYTLQRLNFIGNFGDKKDVLTVILDDENYRKKIIMEAYLRWTPLDSISINKAIKLAFGGGVVVDCTFFDPLDITTKIAPMQCYFYLSQKPIPQIDFLAKAGLFLPRPAGVGILGIVWDENTYNGRFRHDGLINYSESINV